MAKAYTKQTTHHEQDGFGHWLSGFADGEATFLLWHDAKNTPHATFKIDLRADDREILDRIREYLGCGRPLRLKRSKASLTSGTKPQVRFGVDKASDLALILVPHFDQFPLRAKKRHEFLIWKQGVLLLHCVQQRPRWGCHLRWTDNERNQFRFFAESLKAKRVFA